MDDYPNTPETGRIPGEAGAPTPGDEAQPMLGADAAVAERQRSGRTRQRARKVDRVKETVREKAHELEDEARSRAGEVREEVERRADRWTTSVGLRAESVARALRSVSDHLSGEGESAMADVAGQAADQVERMSGYLEDEDPAAMLRGLEDLGRRNPAAFVGASFALGLVAGRFLRASPPEDRDRQEHEFAPSGAAALDDIPLHTTPASPGPLGDMDTTGTPLPRSGEPFGTGRDEEVIP